MRCKRHSAKRKSRKPATIWFSCASGTCAIGRSRRFMRYAGFRANCRRSGFTFRRPVRVFRRTTGPLPFRRPFRSRAPASEDEETALKIVFASAHPYLPQIAGGSQSNTHEMARELLARGHEIGVLAGLTPDGWIGTRGRIMMKLLRRKAIGDRSQGYCVYRSWFAWEGAADVVHSMAPDIIVAQSGKVLRVARAFRETGVPTVIYLHNVEFEDHGEAIEKFGDA
ncbi:MAG: hypothetical protein EPN45_16530, partial [Rhizobiaceae bacterium]